MPRFLGGSESPIYLWEVPTSKHGGKVSRLLLNVLFVEFPVGQVLSPLLQSRQERRKKKEVVTESGMVGCGRQRGRHISLST